MTFSLLIHLLKIDLKKMFNYRTFWVVCGLYFLTVAVITSTGMEFLKWLANLTDQFDAKFDVNRIPLYHFPDVWLNLIWFGGLFKVLLAIMVVISVTNEYSYRTVRQNIIDGLSRSEFLISKILTNLLLSLAGMVLIFGIGLITGLIYSPDLSWNKITTDLEFFPAYFLEIFFFLSYAVLLGVLVQRSGLTIILLLLSPMLEWIVRVLVDDYIPAAMPYFPMESMSNLIHAPYPRYVLREIQDYIDPLSLGIVLTWTVLFNYFSYLKLKHSDL